MLGNFSLFLEFKITNFYRFSSFKPTTSWTSTPDLKSLHDDTRATTVHIKLPARRPVPADTGQKGKLMGGKIQK